MESLILMGAVFISTFFIGQWLERIRIPWIFAALIIGVMIKTLSVPVGGELYKTLSKLGLYFMLFMIGLEIDTRKMSRLGKTIIKSSLFIIGLESVVMGLLIHFAFSLPYYISFLVSMSFATVGEAILLPILDELKLTRKKIGQIIIGVATADDVFEMLTFILLVFVITGNFKMHSLLIFAALLIFTIISLRYHISRKFFSMPVETLFLLVVSILFLFLGIGEISGEEEVAAILSGIVVSHAMPKSKYEVIEKEVKSLAYGFLAPIFFFSVGYETNPTLMIKYFPLVIIFVIASNISKVVSSVAMLRKEIGLKKAVFAGIALSTRFSTSLVISKLLYDYGIITSEIFSIIIASSMIFKFVIPPLLSWLSWKWRISRA